MSIKLFPKKATNNQGLGYFFYLMALLFLTVLSMVFYWVGRLLVCPFPKNWKFKRWAIGGKWAKVRVHNWDIKLYFINKNKTNLVNDRWVKYSKIVKEGNYIWEIVELEYYPPWFDYTDYNNENT